MNDNATERQAITYGLLLEMITREDSAGKAAEAAKPEPTTDDREDSDQ